MRNRRNVFSIRTLSLVGASALAASAIGCAPTNPAPGVHNLGDMNYEITNSMTVSTNTNSRALSNDLGRLFMTDRPSRLTVQTMPH